MFLGVSVSRQLLVLRCLLWSWLMKFKQGDDDVVRSRSFCVFVTDAETPMVQQPTNASEKTQLISDGHRRYGDTYT